MYGVPQRISLRLWTGVEGIAAGQGITGGQMVVQAGDEVILGGNVVHIDVQGLNAIGVGSRGWCHRPQCEIGLNGGYGRGPRSGIGHVNRAGSGLTLAESFIVPEDERLILDDGPTSRSPELNATKWRNGRSIKKVARVKHLVAIKEESGSVKSVGARPGNRVDHRAGSAPVLCCVSCRYHRELLYSIDAKVQAGGPARCRVRVVVNRNAIETVGVLVGAVS